MAAKRKNNGVAHVEQRLTALQADLAQLQKDLRGLANAGGEVASDRFTEVLDTAEAAADRAADQIETWTNENLGSVRQTVRSQPITSVLLSMSAGALVGALFLRR